MNTDINNSNILTKYSKESNLFNLLDDGKIECLACGLKCKLKNDKFGICKIRFNKNGKLFAPHGYVSGIAIDPIEKKPFYHVHPGSKVLSFGMLGCNFHCSFCQNWQTSQAFKDLNAIADIQIISANQIINLALNNNVKILASTYNEPLITSEWSAEIFKIAKQNNLTTAFVSNGNASMEVLDYLNPYVDYFKIDLKSFNQKTYAKLGGILQNVLDTIKYLHKINKWIEIVTLVIPNINDSDEELNKIARFISSISQNIPWHVTAYHKDYKIKNNAHFTPEQTLQNAVDIGYTNGLKYVYAGNISSKLKKCGNTYCNYCKNLLIERDGYLILKNNIVDSKCIKCGNIVYGIWKQ